MSRLIVVNHGEESWTPVFANSELLANRLGDEIGLRPGDRLVSALENSRAHIEMVFAAWRLGLEYIAVPPTASALTFSGILEKSAAPHAVVIDARNERLQRAFTDWSRHTVDIDGLKLGYREPVAPAAARELGERWQDWLGELPPAVFYTSGSTSTAKGVPLLWSKILGKGRAVLRHYGVGTGERVMPILPLSHVYGLYWLMGTIDLGADAIVCRETASPAALAAGIADHGATAIACPPIVGAFLFGRHGCESGVRERLRVLTMGGAATSPEQAKRILANLPRTRVFLSYGLAETYSTVCCNEISVPNSDLASVGRLCFGAYGGARDPQTGLAVAPGEIGELCIGGTIMTGYVGADVEAFTEDGLFRTGDLVRLDTDGAISITGRLKEMINAGGLSVYPAEIEEVLKRHPAVADCGVFGEKAGELEVVCAAVTLRKEIELEQLYDYCSAQLSVKMVPRRIVAVPAIPRGALGKIARAELRALVAAQPPAGADVAHEDGDRERHAAGGRR